MRAGFTLALLAAAAAVVNAQQTAYGQCGGRAYAGPTGCVAGLKCIVLRHTAAHLLIHLGLWQCVPDSVPGDPAPSSSTGSDSGSTPTSTSPTPAPTLKEANVWIRAVADPYVHKYLQSSPPNAPGPAILGPAATAAQFTFTYGALVLRGEGFALFGVVHPEVIGTGVGRLRVTFEKNTGTYGGFTYTGDEVQWRQGGITRPNDSAWLVCGGELFVNLGDFGEQNLVGCTDQTLNFYRKPTAEE